MKKKKLNDKGFKFLKAILKPIFKVYYRPKVINKEVIPKEGPILIVGNHKHIMDQCMAIIATKRPIHYMAKKEYFEGKFAWFFKLGGCICVDRSIHDQEAKNRAIAVLKAGGAIGLFPEGTRNKTEELLLPFKFGTVSMAKQTKATIVPFGITGDYKFRSQNLVIRFGDPFKVDDMTLEEANEKLKQAISDAMQKNMMEER